MATGSYSVKAQSFNLHVPLLLLYFLFLQYFKMGGFFCTKRVNNIYKGALQERNMVWGATQSQHPHSSLLKTLAEWNKQGEREGHAAHSQFHSWSSVSSACPSCSWATRPRWVHTATGSTQPGRGGRWSRPPSRRWPRSPASAGHSGLWASCGTGPRCSQGTEGGTEHGGIRTGALVVTGGGKRAMLHLTHSSCVVSPQELTQTLGQGNPSLTTLRFSMWECFPPSFGLNKAPF